MKALKAGILLSAFLMAGCWDNAMDSMLQGESGPQMDSVIACARDSEVRVTNPRFLDADPCVGSATIQGIAYKCGLQTEVSQRTQEFLDNLNRNARDKCQDFCAARADGCQGSYSDAPTCGFSVPPREAVNVGTKIVGCHPSCDGNAFSYCSIYHGSFFRFDDKLFKDFTPNCYCARKKI